MIRQLRHPLRFHRDHRFTTQHASDYLDGALTEPECRRVETHTGVCPRCRRLVQSLRSTIAALAGLRDTRAAGGDDVAAGVIARLRDEPPA